MLEIDIMSCTKNFERKKKLNYKKRLDTMSIPKF